MTQSSIREASTAAIREAAKMLQAGNLVAFPTETVYGLGANALDGKAAVQIYSAKGRPSFNPLIIHVAELDVAKELASFDTRARKIAAKYWPGPLTLVLPKAENCPVAEICTAGLETIALRIPQHPVAQDLLRRADIPVAAPSANKSGEPSPTAPIHVQQSLGNQVDMILAAGRAQIGLESTVVSILPGTPPELLRHGGITFEMLQEVLPDIVEATQPTDAPRSPGQLLKHYAPSIPVRLNAVDVNPGEALIAFGSTKFMGIKGGGRAGDLPKTQIYNLSEHGDLHEAASHLFAALRALDRPEHKAIAVMNIPGKGVGVAINDRLQKAAQKE